MKMEKRKLYEDAFGHRFPILDDGTVVPDEVNKDDM